MLDDLKMIHHRDAKDMLGVVVRQLQPGSVQQLAMTSVPSRQFTTIVCIGAGEMAHAADYVKVGLRRNLTQPFEVLAGYELPAYVDGGTLCIVADKNGNDTQALTILAQAEAKGAGVVVISEGGVMASIARDKQYPLLALPKTDSAAMDVWRGVAAIMHALKEAGSLAEAPGDMDPTWVMMQVQQWQPEVPAKANLAKRIALDLLGKSAAVYSGPDLAPAAAYWKTAINRYAKQLAWSASYPRGYYDDLAGWTKQPVHKPYAVIELRSSLDNTIVSSGYAKVGRLLSGVRPAPTVVELVGKDMLQQLLYATVLGDFVAIYLAIVSGVDPASLSVNEAFNKEVHNE